MRMTSPDRQAEAVAQRLAAESAAAADPTGWFERLYAGGQGVPWDRGEPHPSLVQWARGRAIAGRRAIVVGSGHGDDAEFVAGLGYDVVAFDVARSAVSQAEQRFPDSSVRYVVANLLDPPAEWRDAFDLVVESRTVQSLPDPARREAATAIAAMVAPGGTLLVIAAGRDDDGPCDGPPWPLTRAELVRFTDAGLAQVEFTELRAAGDVGLNRWVIEYRRPAATS